MVMMMGDAYLVGLVGGTVHERCVARMRHGQFFVRWEGLY